MRIMTLIAGMLMSGVAWAAENPLTPEIGQTRPLVVVTPGASDPLVSELHQVLASPGTVTAFAERQIVVFTVIGGQGARGGRALDGQATAALLTALDLNADGPGAVVLVGKDGGVKLRLKQLAVGDILGAVDAMPMRRQEVRHR